MVVLLGPTPLSGIGQVMLKYCKAFGSKHYFQYGQKFPNNIGGQLLFAFVLPIPQHVQMVRALQTRFRRVVAMTVCETDRVHANYGLLAQQAQWSWVTPSEFCRDTLTRQFPEWKIGIFHHWTPIPRILTISEDTLPYVFYTIANAHDPRKQVRKIVEAFLRANLPNSKLLIKSTSSKPYTVGLPNIEVIDGLLSDEDLQTRVHDVGHCYVSFSNSEGVGMGAVEAALRNKPVIIPEWGGCKEYVKTPYLIPCKEKEIGYDDFLFEKTMKWGDPDMDMFIQYMRQVHAIGQTFMDHGHTTELMTYTNPNIFLSTFLRGVPK